MAQNGGNYSLYLTVNLIRNPTSSLPQIAPALTLAEMRYPIGVSAVFRSYSETSLISEKVLSTPNSKALEHKTERIRKF